MIQFAELTRRNLRIYFRDVVLSGGYEHGVGNRAA